MATTKQQNGKPASKASKENNAAARAMPADHQAELCLLGSIFLMGKVIDDVMNFLSASDFCDGECGPNGLIYAHMCRLREHHSVIDETLLFDRLKVAGDLETVGGAAYLLKVINAVPNAAHAVYYAEIIAEKSSLRRIIECCTDAISEAYDDLPSADVLSSLDAKLAGVELGKRCEPRKIADIAADVLNSLGTSLNASNRAMTGIASVDEIMGPIMGGEIAVVAARTSMGKTSFAQGMLLHSARCGRPALMVSLEMSDREIATRELCRITGIDSRHIRAQNIGDGSRARLWQAQWEMQPLPYYVWSPPRATVAEIRAVARKMAGNQGLSLIAIDLIGHVAPPREFLKRARHEQIAGISGALKSLAKEMGVPVVVLAQLNREAANEEPKLSHLRDGGRIEEDADIVVFLHFDQRNPPDTRTLIIAKHRNGQIGNLLVGWHPMTTTFSDAACQQFE